MENFADKCGKLYARTHLLVYLIAITCAILWDFISYYENAKEKYAIWLTLVAYLIASALYVWCWWTTCWGNPGSLKEFYKEKGILSMIEKGEIPDKLRVLPLCTKCGLPKPRRCHHCSECNECCFRFDHHCPVIGNCVGLDNVKAFILLPFYGGLVVVIGGIQVALLHYRIIGIIFVFVGVMFCGMSLVWCPTICSNQTTLEEIGSMKKNGEDYDVGCASNFGEIFGSLDFFLPTKPPINGFHWERQEVRDYIDSL